ncbi:MAG: XRE family transcriptional regulator [Actinobacteria bacterium]|nr:XRE family transcriptional regulator [Actinomycetota bacterium]
MTKVLTEAHKEAGLTQIQMAKNMGVSQKRISEIKHGRAESICLGTLERYATALGGTLTIEIEYQKADGAKRKLKFPVEA